mmetsp:Transcript_17103/g.55943  ORF Transcript_17103/g.55943 Transcript_17103/m.55943 type:complete len:241 (-) Transcript_17103:149-871(-)
MRSSVATRAGLAVRQRRECSSRRSTVVLAAKGAAKGDKPAGAFCSAALSAALSATLALSAFPAVAIYDSGLDAPIEDEVEALSVVYAAREAMQALEVDIEEMSKSCPAPTFPCDLSRLTVKASSRVSGPLKRSLPTLTEKLEADPYAAEATLQSVASAEAILYSNNARVKVDWKGPVANLALAETDLSEVLIGLPAEAVDKAKARFDACDLTVAPEAPGELTCRLRRAVVSGARPAGGIG